MATEGRTIPIGDTHVAAKTLAEIVGLSRSHFFKFAKRHGFKATPMRLKGSGGQLAASFTREEAMRLIAFRREEWAAPADDDAGLRPNFQSPDLGVFYMVQLIPEFDPRRIKFGFAADMAARLSQHMTAAPTAVVYREWPARREWERLAILAATATGARLIRSEVYECDDAAATAERVASFFGLLPAPESIHAAPAGQISDPDGDHESQAASGRWADDIYPRPKLA